MRKLTICILSLMLLAACVKEAVTTPPPSTPPSESSTSPLSQSSVSSVPKPAVATEASKEAEASVLSPQIGVSDVGGGWTAYSAAFLSDENLHERIGLKYVGSVTENKLAFIGCDSEDYRNKITIIVVDISNLENMEIIAKRQFDEPDAYYGYTDVRPGMVLCQYGTVTEIMDEKLETVRTIELPPNENADIRSYRLNDDFSVAVYSNIVGTDFENCTITVQPLDSMIARTKFSSFMEADIYHTALMNPQFVANGKKLIAPQVGFEFTASYVLMDFNGQNRQSYNHGGSYFDISDKMIGNDFYILDVRVEREGDLQVRYPELYKIDTITGKETLIYKATENHLDALDYNENYMLLQKGAYRPNNDIDRLYLFDIRSGETETIPDKMNEMIEGLYKKDEKGYAERNKGFHWYVTDDGKIITTQMSDRDNSVVVTIFAKNN